MQKDFPGWHRQKEQLHAQHHTPTFQEREIWWCSVGVNIGPLNLSQFVEDQNGLHTSQILLS
jgi:hypothetical protein